ncbi:cobalt ECF transporter T component CbiQ [Eubacterium barkeri]|uniref:Cobalt/nickel transport system permease protein n=1 Tax=Eubacterium barkeri TaxID=1528 RepID=A0A1H3FFX4_EUBBA|nr:cobalt ECF transporter T component CbiQ [Eubacterium barkeri]SDX89891.1 cobalt/nickel transport system permease protein [Eubacterium barkeri]
MDVKLLWLVPPLLVLLVGCIYQMKDGVRNGHHHHRGFGHKHGESTLSIDIYAYTSKLGGVNPGFKVGFAIILLLMCVVADNLYVSISVILITTFVTVILGGIHFRKYLELLAIPIAFLIIGSIVILVNFSWGPAPESLVNLDCRWFTVFVTREGLGTTINLWGKAFGAVSAMYMMSLSTMSGEIFSVLRRLHVPMLIVELMNIMYRYIFILMDTQSRMRNSAESRLGYTTYKRAIYSFGNTAGNLLIVSMKRGGQFYDAMEARCYDGELKFLEDKKPLVAKQVILAALVVIYLVVVWIATMR